MVRDVVIQVKDESSKKSRMEAMRLCYLPNLTG